MSKLSEIYTAEELGDALEEAIKKVHKMEQRVQEFEEDRYCQGGCVVYQLDKLKKFKDYFKDIRDGIVMMKSYCTVVDKFQNSVIFETLDRLYDECTHALEGKEWDS